MDRAAAFLVDALETDRPMVVFADYDVDGAASAALLVRWFRHMGKPLPIYVPDRLSEGYGPNPAAFRHLHAQGAGLVVTVDCGAAAQDAVAAAGEIGLDIVVVDHHLMRARRRWRRLPWSIQTVPIASQVKACWRPPVSLSSCWRRSIARPGQGACSRTRLEPDIRQWLDLAAMGAICDVTQLVGFNRAIAALGLKVMSAWANPGLAALMEVAGDTTREAGVFQAGFVLGPRIKRRRADRPFRSRRAIARHRRSG